MLPLFVCGNYHNVGKNRKVIKFYWAHKKQMGQNEQENNNNNNNITQDTCNKKSNKNSKQALKQKHK